jgi:DNA-binding protein HU-beta
MNKNDLVDAVSASTGLSKSDGASAIDTMLDSIASALKEGDEVRLPGFGIFSVAHRKASEGRNPRTGEAIQIPASKLPKFKAGKTLKQALN